MRIIGNHCSIAESASLEPFVVIRDEVSIGSFTWIKEFCCIYSGVIISDHCKLRAGCVICEHAEISEYCEFGVGVTLQDHYRLAAFTNQKDTVKPPKVGRGCRIGSYSQLNAGCELKRNVILLPNSVVLQDQTLDSGVYGMREGRLVKLRPLREDEVI